MTGKAGAERFRIALAAVSHARLGLMAGTAAGLAVVLTLGDPGLTIDEPLDVRPGRTYVATLQAGAGGSSSAESSIKSSVTTRSTPRWDAGCWVWPRAWGAFPDHAARADPTGLYVLSGRLAPALAFALLVGVVAAESSRRWVVPPGSAPAGLSCHAPCVCPCSSGRPGYIPQPVLDPGSSGRRASHGVLRLDTCDHRRGAFWSLALLTKIHAWLLLPILAIWAFTRLSWRCACKTIVIWTFTAVGLFLAAGPGSGTTPGRDGELTGGRQCSELRSWSSTSARSCLIATCPGIIPGSTLPSPCRSACSFWESMDSSRAGGSARLTAFPACWPQRSWFSWVSSAHGSRFTTASGCSCTSSRRGPC